MHKATRSAVALLIVLSMLPFAAPAATGPADVQVAPALARALPSPPLFPPTLALAEEMANEPDDDALAMKRHQRRPGFQSRFFGG